MSIDDRIRTAITATAATVREIPPLNLPPEGAPARPGRRAFRRPRGRRSGWLVPLAAAAAVLAVAAVLVAVRDLPGIGHASGPPAAPAGTVTGLPRYGVVLTKTTARVPPSVASGPVEVSDLSVIDTRGGKRVAVVKHPPNFSFSAVSGAADDRTFAVSGTAYIPQPLPADKSIEYIRAFYLLRIDPGGSRPATLTRLAIPVQPQDAVISGLALSPDGRTLAVMEWCTVPGACFRGSPGTLQLYSVATGKALRVWTWGTLPDPAPSHNNDQNGAGLTWLAGGRVLGFTYYAHGQAPAVRTLDTARPGGDLAAASRPVFTLPSGGSDACQEAVLTPDGRTVICVAQSVTGATAQPRTLEIDAYSAATGKRERVLFRYTTGQFTPDGVGALGWVGPGNAVVAMLDTGIIRTSMPAFRSKVVIGVVDQGRLVPLLPATVPFGQGLGAIAL